MTRAASKATLLPLLAWLLAWQPLPAAVVPDLYVAQVPAAGLSGPALDGAFALALDQVLVKVTGRRDAGADPARRRAVGAPATLVRQYQPAPGGQLRVSFEPAALLRGLDAARLPVWADDRPLTLVVLPPEPAPADPAAPTAGAVSLRQAFETVAAIRGLPVAFGPPAQAADATLEGRPAPTGGAGLWQWTLTRGDERQQWTGDLAEGAHGLADRLADRLAGIAAEGGPLLVRITGVTDFETYGRLQAYLRSVGLIRSAELRGIEDGALVYGLEVRGDVARLNAAFALRRLLEPVGAGGAGELLYRVVPDTGPVAAREP